MSQLADWKCHKVVKAGRITQLPTIDIPTGEWLVGVEDVNGATTQVKMPPDAFARGRPTMGDYIVVYDDDYKSWSPAKTFEDGYDRLPKAS